MFKPVHLFEVLIDGEIKSFHNFDDIPMEFENLITFKPQYIPPPHTPEEHILNAQWEDKFKELMKRETK